MRWVVVYERENGEIDRVTFSHEDTARQHLEWVKLLGYLGYLEVFE